jgi:hypothetical protein
MTDEEIQEIGRQCIDNIGLVGHWELLEFAERVSRAAVAAEREACAALCDDISAQLRMVSYMAKESAMANFCADRIRDKAIMESTAAVRLDGPSSGTQSVRSN